MKTSAFILALATTASLLGAVTSTSAQVGETRRSDTSRALGFCDGFAQEAVFTNHQNAAQSTSSPSFVTMPSTTIDGGASGTIDLYTVTLSGEALVTGGGNYEVQAQVSIDGGPFVNMNPNQPDTFHSSSLRETHTMTWCREIRDAGSTRFRIVWRKNGGGAAIIDDYIMRVERSD